MTSEYKTAERVGFDLQQLQSTRAIFSGLDTENFGCLDMEGIREAIRQADIPWAPAGQHFEVAFQALDKNGSGLMTFEGFIEFLRMVRDQDGPFRGPATTRASTIMSLGRLDLFFVLECLNEPDANAPESKLDTRAALAIYEK